VCPDNGLNYSPNDALNGVEPLGYLADVLTRIVNGRPNSQIDDLLPWAYIQASELKAVA
jgi:transposase